MGLKRVTKKFLRFLIPTLIVLALIPLSVGELSQSGKNPYENAQLRCVIALDSIETLRTGYLTDYNYELLKQFASDNSARIRITLAEDGADYSDSLLCDSIDILVAPATWKGEATFRKVMMTDSTGTWFIKPDRKKMKYLDLWLGRFVRMENYFSFYNRFFACYNPYRKGRDKRILTPYDDLLKDYSKSIGWDWKLLASLMWNESRFKISVKSKRGAQGLMQVMPASAAKFGITDLLDPEENIKCSVQILSRLQDILKGYGIEGAELTKYTLAAYNAGSGNITDAISTARSKKVDVSRWSTFAEYFTGERNDALRFEGLETIAYVRVVLGRYDIFRGVVPQNSAQEKEIELEEQQVEQMIDSLGSDSLGGIDPGNEETRDEEQEQDDKIRDSVGKEDSR